MAGLGGDQLATMQKDTFKLFFQVVSEAAEKSMIKKIYADERPESRVGEGNKETQLLGFDNLDKITEENGDISYVAPSQGWSTLGRKEIFAKGIILSYKSVEFSVKLADKMKTFARQMADADAETKEKYAATPFNSGDVVAGDSFFDGSFYGETDSSGDVLYDGVCLFNLSGNLRTSKGGGTYYNRIPSVNLTAASYRSVFVLVTDTNAYNENDEVIMTNVDTLLTANADDYLTAKEIVLNTQNYPDGQLNNQNVLRGTTTPMLWRYITNTAFFVGQAKHPSWEWMEKDSPEIEFFRDQSNGAYCMRFMDYWGTHFHVGAARAWAEGSQ